MAYIGKTPTIGNFQVCDAISVVNGQAAYTMQVNSVNVSPESANHMLVSLNGILQKPGSSFTVSGSTITFASNLVTGDVIDFIQILGNVLDLGVPSDNTVSLAKLTATGTKDATTFLRGDNSFQEVSSGLTLIKSVTASGASSVEFKNGVSDVVIDSTYSYYRIVGFNITPSEDDRNIFIQFSTDAGSSYASSGYYTMIHRNTDGTFRTDLNSTGSALNMNNVGNGTNEEGAFEFTVFNPSSSSHFTHYQSMGTTRNSGAQIQFFEMAGVYEATSAIDAFKIAFSSGNISGTFKLYGIK